MLFSPSIAYVMTGRCLLATFVVGTNSFPSSITIFGGSQPSAATVTANWGAYRTAFLAHFPGAAWSQPGQGPLLQLTVPPAAAATLTGTATWAIIWDSSLSLATVQGNALPSTVFAVVPVSLNTGTGVIRLSNTSLVAATSYTIYDGSFGVTTP